MQLLPKPSPVTLPPNSLTHSHTHIEAQNLLTQQCPLNSSEHFHWLPQGLEEEGTENIQSQVHIDYQLHTCVRWIMYLVCLSEHQSSTLWEVTGNQTILGSPSTQNRNLTASSYLIASRKVPMSWMNWMRKLSVNTKTIYGTPFGSKEQSVPAFC